MHLIHLMCHMFTYYIQFVFSTQLSSDTEAFFTTYTTPLYLCFLFITFPIMVMMIMSSLSYPRSRFDTGLRLNVMSRNVMLSHTYVRSVLHDLRNSLSKMAKAILKSVTKVLPLNYEEYGNWPGFVKVRSRLLLFFSIA